MTATDTYLLLRAFCDELARCGMTDACTSPGSRNTPLVLSLAREPNLRTFSHIDERSAGFFALGAAKASGRPVAITCTSGSAVANFAPAVIEAHEARVPLIVLTADRPPELRDVGAGQTIDQLKFYGDAVKWFVEVGVYEATDANLRWIRQLAGRAYWTALQGRPGPVHLNFPLREPLILSEPLPDDASGRLNRRPWVTRRDASPAAGSLAAGSLAAGSLAAGSLAATALPGRGVVVAGRYERDTEFGAAVARFAERAAYPLLADPLSGARHGPASIPRYDLLLRNPRFTAGRVPELVIRVGDLPTSKPLRTWLGSLTAAGTIQLTIDPEGAWQDPACSLTESLAADPVATLTAATPDGPIDPDWLAAWRSADDAASIMIEQALRAGLSEPAVAGGLSEWLPPNGTLFVASSMPIRDVELFAGNHELAPRYLSNRGANGIDGTVSSAFGVAAVSDGPVVLLIGDVALLHDVGGLLAARRHALNLTIVLLNNDGGGIFHFLPVSSQTDAFEEHIATPHGLDFSHAAQLYGCSFERPADLESLRAAVARSIAEDDTTIIEVVTDRKENLALHRRIAESVIPPAPEAAPRA
jgi:2-succinyl-5-enolpyruvyl-6-hydroxy-3-cyclohexene-1-carboxylate synthase